MSVRRKPHSLLLNGASQITQFTDVKPSRTFERISETSAGQPSPSFIGVTSVVDDVEFTTGNLDTILGVCQAEGICAFLSGGNSFLYYRKQQSGGKNVAVASTVHDSIQMPSNAFVYWNSLEAEQRGIATLSGRVLPISADGITDPWTLNEDVAIPAGIAIASLYTLGPVVINGTLLGSLKKTSVENNNQVDEDDFAGNTYLTFAGIDTWSPRFTFETTEPRHFKTYGCVALTSLDVYFRKIQKNSKPYADASEEHIKISANGTGLITAEDVSGRKAGARLVVDLDQPDEDTDPYTVTTDTAIVLP